MKKGNVAIVTGGTRGMGRAISLELAKSGAIVYGVYRSNEKAALEFKSELQGVSPQSDILKADVSKGEDTNRMVSYVGEKHGKIDCLINNAGIFEFCFLEEMTEKDIDNIMNVNFKSQVLTTIACIPYLKKSENGRIINASSVSGKIADVGLVGYGASKAGVNMLTSIAAAELAPYNITVNAYAPGIIATEMTSDMIAQRGAEQVKQIPLNRFGTDADISSLVSFLASDQSAYITGQVIGIDGGFFQVQNPYRAHEHKAGK